MRRLITILTGLLVASGAAGGESLLQGLEPLELGEVACGCTFNESIADSDEGSYGSGPMILVLDPNGEPPNARVNLGEGDVRLRPKTPVEFPLYECEVGSIWVSRWESEDVVLQLGLVALAPGYEACWFSGVVAASVGSKETFVPVKGACGC